MKSSGREIAKGKATMNHQALEGRSCFRFAALIVLGGFSLLIGACSTAIQPRPQCDFIAFARAQQEAPPAAGPVLIAAVPGTMTDMPLNTVNITDFTITNKVLVQTTNGTRLPGGQVAVYARVVNCTDFPLQVEGRTHFLNETQAPVEAVSAWQRVHLPARSIGHYKVTSLQADEISTYLIEIREGK